MNISIQKSIVTLSFIFVCSFVFYSPQVSADTFPPFYCSDGGTVTTTGSITPTGPFPAGTNSIVTATGQITSTCGTTLGGAKINLSVKNNDNTDTLATLISDTIIPPGTTFPFVPATAIFQTPNRVGQYAIHLTTGVEEESARYCWASDIQIIGGFRSWGVQYIGPTLDAQSVPATPVLVQFYGSGGYNACPLPPNPDGTPNSQPCHVITTEGENGPPQSFMLKRIHNNSSGLHEVIGVWGADHGVVISPTCDTVTTD